MGGSVGGVMFWGASTRVLFSLDGKIIFQILISIGDTNSATLGYYSPKRAGQCSSGSKNLTRACTQSGNLVSSVC